MKRSANACCVLTTVRIGAAFKASIVLRNKEEKPNGEKWWLEPESNRRHEDFQSSALPTELSSPKAKGRRLN